MDVEELQQYHSSLLNDKPNNVQGIKGRLVMGFSRAKPQNTDSINLYKQQATEKHLDAFHCWLAHYKCCIWNTFFLSSIFLRIPFKKRLKQIFKNIFKKISFGVLYFPTCIRFNLFICVARIQTKKMGGGKEYVYHLYREEPKETLLCRYCKFHYCSQVTN